MKKRIMHWAAYTYSYSLLLFAFFLPAHTRFTGVFIVIALLSWLVVNRFHISLPDKMLQGIIGCLVALFGCYGIGLIYTSDQPDGWRHMQLWSSMVLFPFIFMFPSKLPVPAVARVMKWFVAGSIAISVILLMHGAYIFFTEHRNIFFYGDLTGFLRIHPAYISMYFDFIIVTISWQMLKHPVKKHNLFFHIGVVLFFLMMVVILSAREEIIALVIALILMFSVHFFEKRQAVKGIVAVLLTISLLVILLFAIPLAGQRFIDIEQGWSTGYSNQHPTSINVRKAAWETSAELIRRYPIFGLGTGDVEDSLLDHYQQKNLEWPFHDRLNAHNQFIQTALGLGFFGLAALLLLFIVSFSLAMRYSNYNHLFFLLIFLVSIITESMFETETGVLFFSLFNTLFIASYSDTGDLKN
jgi:O-antigen ligase